MAEVRAKGEDKREKVEDEWSISWKGRKILGELVFQSRSGPPSQAWLEPDIRDRVQELSDARNVTGLVIVPIGFLAENMEVVYDLDVETCGLCNSLGLSAIRADVVGRHPSFVRMIRELIGERVEFRTERVAIGRDAAWPDECPGDCCMANKQ
jgi:ferrochelatase